MLTHVWLGLLLITYSNCGAVTATYSDCGSSKRHFVYRDIATPTVGPSPVQSLSVAVPSVSQCLLRCSLNTNLPCRSVCYQQQPIGICNMYSRSESGFNYQLPANCQMFKTSRTDGYSNCREVWVGNRRFCVLQQRISGSVLFNRSWVEYENGFGNSDNFWTGLKTLNQLTSSPSSPSSYNGTGATIRFEMTKWDGSQYVSEYDGFRVGDAATSYTLNYSRYAAERSTPPLIDSLQERSLGMMFSTMDRDNDQFATGSCSIMYGGRSGWWFRSCFYANPNGIFVDSQSSGPQYITWYYIFNDFLSLKTFRIMILME